MHRLGVGWSLVEHWSDISRALVGHWSGIGRALVGIGHFGQVLVGHSWGIHQNSFLVLHFILFSGNMSAITGKRMRKKSIHKRNAPAMQ